MALIKLQKRAGQNGTKTCCPSEQYLFGNGDELPALKVDLNKILSIVKSLNRKLN